MKHAVVEMTRLQREDVVVSFMHGQGIELQKTPLGMYRALLNSMLRYFPDYLSQLTETFTDQQMRFGSYTEDRWYWADKELRDILFSILTQGSRKRSITIFIDAIDECGEVIAERLFTEFRDIVELAKLEKPQVKICISSRHYPILDFDSIPTISVQTRNHADIRTVIENRLRHVEPYSRRQEVQRIILSKAQGGFQWATLVTNLVVKDIKNGKRLDELERRIASLPDDLDKLYADILDTTDEVEESQMVKLFQWVLFAERPLSTLELRDALAADKGMTTMTVSKLKCHQSWKETLAQFEQHINYLSRGLVEFGSRDVYEQYELDGEEPDKEAQFIHPSVADYLSETFLSKSRWCQYNSSPAGAGHFEISRSCLRYLALSEVMEATQLPRGTLSAKFPLAPYATRYIFSHIRKVERYGVSQPDLMQLFQWDVKSESIGPIARLWKVFDPSNAYTPVDWPFVGTTTAHVLVALGSKSALEAFLKNSG